MRYVAGFTYGLAAGGGATHWLDGLVVGGLIFVGTVALVFAVEGIVEAAANRHCREPDLPATLLGD